MRGRSYTPSPPRGYGRRGRSPSPRGRYGGRSRDLPTSLLVRNLRRDCRQEDLRRPFGQFGALKDIYLPRDYYTGEPRGFGFVQYVDPADAAEAKYHMDGQILQGRQLTVVFAEENRKKPSDMRARERGGGSGIDFMTEDDLRLGILAHLGTLDLHLHAMQDRDPAAVTMTHHLSQDKSQESVSPQEKRYSRDRSYSRRSRERSYSRSPAVYNGSRSRSRSPVREHSPPYNGSRSRSQSPIRERSPVRSRSPSRSRSPNPVDYSREPRDESPSQ
ncbi:unnamed protein product [Camellia sinensis]